MSFKPFSCPACGADFEVRERLDEQDKQKEETQTDDERQAALTQEQTVECPNCGTPVEAA